jgi:hypothetical protein
MNRFMLVATTYHTCRYARNLRMLRWPGKNMHPSGGAQFSKVSGRLQHPPKEVEGTLGWI